MRDRNFVREKSIAQRFQAELEPLRHSGVFAANVVGKGIFAAVVTEPSGNYGRALLRHNAMEVHSDESIAEIIKDHLHGLGALLHYFFQADDVIEEAA